MASNPATNATGVQLITGNNLPPPQSPWVDPKTGVLSVDGYQWLLGALNQLASTVPTQSIAKGIAAKGSTQSTAQPLTASWNEVDTATFADDGVLLSQLQPGQSQTVFNASGSGLPINVYPPPGANIDTLAVNAPYVLNSGLRQTFDFLSPSQIRSGD
jgi:hypothetical protein